MRSFHLQPSGGYLRRNADMGEAMKKTRIILIVAATALLAACNTMQGFGKDLESAGKTVSDAAK